MGIEAVKGKQLRSRAGLQVQYDERAISSDELRLRKIG